MIVNKNDITNMSIRQVKDLIKLTSIKDVLCETMVLLQMLKVSCRDASEALSEIAAYFMHGSPTIDAGDPLVIDGKIVEEEFLQLSIGFEQLLQRHTLAMKDLCGCHKRRLPEWKPSECPDMIVLKN